MNEISKKYAGYIVNNHLFEIIHQILIIENLSISFSRNQVRINPHRRFTAEGDLNKLMDYSISALEIFLFSSVCLLLSQYLQSSSKNVEV